MVPHVEIDDRFEVHAYVLPNLYAFGVRTHYLNATAGVSLIEHLSRPLHPAGTWN